MLKGRNPALDLYRSQAFVAERDGVTVGRIVGIINHVANQKSGVDFVRFGFIDFIDDDEVAEALICAVEKWGRAQGMTDIHGPLGFTDFDPEGMLTWGFDQLGTMVGIYNYPYYPEQLRRLGFHQAAEWVEYRIPVPEKIPEKHLKIAEIARDKYGLRILKFKSTSQIIKQGYGRKLFELLNITYAHLYGFSQLNNDLIDFYIKQYIPLLKLDFITLIVNADDDLVAFGVALPSLSRALQKAGGRMYPFGFIHLLRALRGKAEVCDLMLIAAHPDYQNVGVVALLFTELIPNFRRQGVKYAESNPELEDNYKVQALWKDFNPVLHKRRAVFARKIRC